MPLKAPAFLIGIAHPQDKCASVTSFSGFCTPTVFWGMSGSRKHKIAASYQRVTWTTKLTSRGLKDRQTVLKSTPRRSVPTSPWETPTSVDIDDGAGNTDEDPIEPLALPKSKVCSHAFASNSRL